MSDLQTKPKDQDVYTFLNSEADEKKREACNIVLELMEEVTGSEPKMWGNSIAGFGSYHYKYKSGREGDWFLTGFAPQKKNLTLYIMSGFTEHDSLLSDLGKYTTGKSCLYINKLEDIDIDVLRELVKESVKHVRETGLNHPCFSIGHGTEKVIAPSVPDRTRWIT